MLHAHTRTTTAVILDNIKTKVKVLVTLRFPPESSSSDSFTGNGAKPPSSILFSLSRSLKTGEEVIAGPFGNNSFFFPILFVAQQNTYCSFVTKVAKNDKKLSLAFFFLFKRELDRSSSEATVVFHRPPLAFVSLVSTPFFFFFI